MTREEAIAELSVLHERLSNPKDCEDGCYSWEYGWYAEAVDMAIEALKGGDAVKRETTWTINSPITISAVQGEWIYKTNDESVCEEWKCSKCGNWNFVKTNFCPHCGARMKSGAE